MKGFAVVLACYLLRHIQIRDSNKMSAYPEKVQKANEEVLDTARDVVSQIRLARLIYRRYISGLRMQLGGIRGNPKVVDTMLSSASGFTRDGVEYTVRNAFGGIWARDGLELKYRSLSVIS